MASRKEITSAYTLLLIATVVWGAMFVPQKTAMLHTGPFAFGGFRFLLGGSLLFIVSKLLGRKYNRDLLKQGFCLGCLIFLGSATQQIGMQHTTATNGGFITGLYLLFVPLQLTLLEGRSLNTYLWIGAVLSFAGLGLLCITDGLSINYGDIWIFICALLFTQHIIFADKVVTKYDFLCLAAVQFTMAGIFNSICALIFEREMIAGAQHAIPQILFGGIASIGFAHTVQLFAQRFIPPAKSALLCSLEAVFAALGGWYILNETLSIPQFIGCLLMFAGISIACVKSNEIKI